MSSHAAPRLVALLVPLVLAGPAAHAQRVATDDAAGDAQRLDWDQSGKNDPVFVPAPEETSTDIIRTVVDLGGKRLRVSVHFRDLVRVTDHETSVEVRTSSRDLFRVGIDKDEGSRLEVSLTHEGSELECHGIDAGIDRTGDRVTLSVPAACLGRPRWVQLGIGVLAAADSATGDPLEFDFFADDAYRSDVRSNSLGKGPKVRRG